MRTRTSWRNQERLFKILGGQPIHKPVPEIVEISRCGVCKFYAAPLRSRSTCKMLSQKVYASAQKECFTKK